MTGSVTPSRIRGILREAERGVLLEAPDGHVWRLQGAQAFGDLVDRPVIVEAYRRTPTLLETLWIGPDL